MKKLLLTTLVLIAGIFCLKAQPVANFEVDVTEGCSPLYVTFDASSSLGDIIFYKWDFFENGGIVEGPNLSTYTKSFIRGGTDVQLTVTDASGLTASHLATDVVMVRRTSRVTDLDTTICQGDTFVVGGTEYNEFKTHGSERIPNFVGCDSIIFVNVTIASDFEIANQKITHIPCTQPDNGSIYFNLVCGTPPYSYEWTPSISGAENNPNGLSEGTYSVTVTDADDNTATESFVILDPGPLGLTLTGMPGPDPYCFGEEAKIEYEMTGGLPPYRRVIDGVVRGGFSYNMTHSSGMPNGTYEFGIIDANGCVEHFPDSITFLNDAEYLEIESIFPFDTIICPEQSVLLGIVAPQAATYSWNAWPGDDIDCPSCSETLVSPSETTTYTVTIISDDGCLFSESINVLVLDFYSTIDTTLCEGESIVVNGTVYDEGNPSGTEIFPSSNASCDSVVQIMLSFTTQMGIVNEVVENVPLQQTSGGSISFDIYCGTAPFTYAWSPDMPGVENIATDLEAGIYTVTVTDDLGDTVVGDFEIIIQEDPDFLDLYDVAITYTSFCGGGPWSVGCVQLDWIGGIAPYKLHMISGGVNDWLFTTTSDHTFQKCDLYEGTYQFWVEDANGLRDTFPNLITIVADNPGPEPSISPDDPTMCLGDTILLEVTATGAISYNWIFMGGYDMGDYVGCDTCSSTLLVAEGIGPLGAVVVVEDAIGCYALDTLIIDVEECGPFSIEVLSVTDPVCYNGDGTVNFQINGGEAPFQIIQDGNPLGAFFFNTNHSISRLPGTYEFAIVDNLGETVDFPNPITFVNQAGPFEVVSVFPEDTTICAGESVLLGLVAPNAVSYAWSPEVSVDCTTCPTTLATPLETTTYVYSVQDSLGCTIVDTIRVDIYNSNLTIINDTLCSSESIIIGGSNVYDVSNPTGEETLQSSNGCDSIVQIDLTFFSNMQFANIIVEDVPAQQTSGGSISFEIGGCSVGPYTYDWAPTLPGVENLATNLIAGTYTVTVTDAIGNSIENSFLVEESISPGTLVLNATHVSEPICGGYNGNGCMEISWTGGTPPYSVTGENIDTGSGFSVGNTSDTLIENCWGAEGSYQISIIDSNGETDTFPTLIVFVADSPLPEVSIISPDSINCLGDTISLLADAPTATSYYWTYWDGYLECDDCSETQISLEETPTSTAVIQVEDANGCWNGDTIHIEVEICDPVWPGDTDTSTVVDNFDLINIGLAYDTMGPLRPGASLAWFAQEADDWAQTNPNGSNYKHADTDGNGTVNADDTLAIIQNWGEMHNFTGDPIEQFIPDYPPAISNSGITMPFYVEPDTFEQGEMVTLSVILGEEGAPAEDVYGIAFSLEYDPELIVPGSAYLTFEESWAGDINQDMISIQRAFIAPGRIDIGLTRTDHTNRTGFGQFAELFITIEDDILFQGNPEIEAITSVEALFNVTNVLIVNRDGEALDVITMETTSLIQGETSSTNNIKLNDQVQIFPNPASDQIFVNTKGLIIEELEVFELTGTLVKQRTVNGNQAKLSTSGLENGVYIVRIQTKEGVVNRRVVVQR